MQSISIKRNFIRGTILKVKINGLASQNLYKRFLLLFNRLDSDMDSSSIDLLPSTVHGWTCFRLLCWTLLKNHKLVHSYFNGVALLYFD